MAATEKVIEQVYRCAIGYAPLEAIAVKKKPLGTPEVMVPDLVSTCDYNLSLVIS
jgi:hypothetical protein